MCSSVMPKICNDRSFNAYPLSICFVTVAEIQRLPINSDYASFAGVSSSEVPCGRTPSHTHMLTSTALYSSQVTVYWNKMTIFVNPVPISRLWRLTTFCHGVSLSLNWRQLPLKWSTSRRLCWHPMQRWLDPHCVCGLINQAHWSPLAHLLLRSPSCL